MAIYSPFTKIVSSNEAVVAPGATISAQGQALVRAKGALSAGVLPSTGGTNEEFAGFVLAQTSAAPFPETYTNKVESYVVPSTGSITLDFAPVTGQISVYDVTAGAVDSSITVSGNTVSGLTAGNEVRVVYKYALTVVQARALYGDVNPGGYAGDQVGQVGVAKIGTIATTEFDASVQWDAVTAIKLAANGQVTGQAGSGITIAATVVKAPTAEAPFLTLEFAAP